MRTRRYNFSRLSVIYVRYNVFAVIILFNSVHSLQSNSLWFSDKPVPFINSCSWDYWRSGFFIIFHEDENGLKIFRLMKFASVTEIPIHIVGKRKPEIWLKFLCRKEEATVKYRIRTKSALNDISIRLIQFSNRSYLRYNENNIKKHNTNKVP